MPQITQGIRSILSIPKVYSWFSSLLNGDASYQTFVEDYIRPQAGDRILDIGCGPGDIVQYLPETIQYVGFDASPEYIEAAQKNFGRRATFKCQRVNEATLQEYSQNDIVLALGVLHHLDDQEALYLFKVAKAHLKPGGKLLTWDGCYVDQQSPIARWLLSKDRGQNVRTADSYLRIAQQVFNNIKSDVRNDMLFLPYTHLILECRDSGWNVTSDAKTIQEKLIKY